MVTSRKRDSRITGLPPHPSSPFPSAIQTTLWPFAPLKCRSILVLGIATSFNQDVTREAATRIARGLCIAAGRPYTPVVQGATALLSTAPSPAVRPLSLLNLLSCAFPFLPLPPESPRSCTQLSLLPSPTLSVSFPRCALPFFPPALPCFQLCAPSLH
ncbi:unnamed protein product [Closterium sp. Yama58-4]|nr:unnamed protein product [Closterium sp. Yama58-4]